MRQRALSLRAASECETAVGKTCKCRCGGAYHGAARAKDVRTLPLDDPHSPSTPCPACTGTGKRTSWSFEKDDYVEVPCFKCDGKGRVITRAVQRAALPELKEGV